MMPTGTTMNSTDDDPDCEPIKPGDPGSPFMLNPMLGISVFYDEPASKPNAFADVFVAAFDAVGVQNTRVDAHAIAVDNPDDSLGRALVQRRYSEARSNGPALECAAEFARSNKAHESRIRVLSCSATGYRSAGGFKFNHFGMLYAHGDWSDGPKSAPEATLEISVGTLPNPLGVDRIVTEFLSRASAAGKIAHGLIDLDWYVANHGAQWCADYTISPRLPDRDPVKRNWLAIGSRGRDACFGPREGLIIGSRLLAERGIRSIDQLRTAIDLDGLPIRFSALSDGSIVVLTVPWLGDFGLALRSNAATRENTALLTKRLISAGLVNPDLVIEHVEWWQDDGEQAN